MLDRMRALAAMTAAIFIAVCAPAHAGAGDLDPSFAQDGKVALLSAGSFVARGLAAAPDGRIVVGGYSCVPGASGNGTCQGDGDSSFRLARFTPDGGLDAEWGDKGLVTTPVGTGRSQIFDVLVQPDGRVLAAGVARDGGRDSFTLARYDDRGALDRSFGAEGVVFTPVGTGFSAIADVAFGPGGTIIAVGQARDGADRPRMAVARFAADGSLDPTFGGFGSVLLGSAGYGYALGGWAASDGTVFAAGIAGDSEDPATYRTGVARLEAGGSVTRVDEHRVGTSSSFANALAGLPDGRWVSAGAATDAEGRQAMALMRGLPGGGLDTRFDDDGVTLLRTMAGAVANDLAVLADERVVVAGQAATGTGEQVFALARLDAGGRLDPAFGGGVVTTSWPRFGVARATAVAIDARGRTLAAGIGCADGTGTQCEDGTVNLALARYLADPPPADPRPVPPADTRAPAVRLSLPGAMRRRTLARTGLRVRWTLDEEAAITVRLLHGRTVLARRALGFSAAARTIRLRPAARRLPRSGRFRLRLELRAADRAGNAGTLRRNLRVRR